MITPKRQAELLREQFSEIDGVDPSSIKQCILVCVGELIASTHYDDFGRAKNRMDKEFWQEVKKEVEKSNM